MLIIWLSLEAALIMRSKSSVTNEANIKFSHSGGIHPHLLAALEVIRLEVHYFHRVGSEIGCLLEVEPSGTRESVFFQSQTSLKETTNTRQF